MIATGAPIGPRVNSDASPDGSPFTAIVIRSVIRWVETDGILRTHEELVEVAKEMGFKRMGSRIRERIATLVDEKN